MFLHNSMFNAIFVVFYANFFFCTKFIIFFVMQFPSEYIFWSMHLIFNAEINFIKSVKSTFESHFYYSFKTRVFKIEIYTEKKRFFGIVMSVCIHFVESLMFAAWLASCRNHVLWYAFKSPLHYFCVFAIVWISLNIDSLCFNLYTSQKCVPFLKFSIFK